MPKYEFLIDREKGEMHSYNFDTDKVLRWHPENVCRWRIQFECEEEPKVLADLDQDSMVITGKKKHEEPPFSPGTDTESS